jgi:hypothetical protein
VIPSPTVKTGLPNLLDDRHEIRSAPTLPRLPISVLMHNIAPAIEKVAEANAIDLRQAVDARVAHPEIDLICDAIAPRGPYADHASRKVVVFESHLAFIWAYIYSNFVIFEQCIQAEMLKGDFDWTIRFDRQLTMRAKSLLDWAVKFAKVYAPWDEDALPNPKTQLDDEEKSMCEKANQIYLTAVNFLFLHEYAHLALKHTCSRDDENWSIEQEKEADNFAMSCITPAFSTEKERHLAGLSIVLLCASNLFLPRELRGIWQSAHPHLHDRLRNALTGLNLQSEKSKYYLYHLGCVCLQHWFQANEIATSQATEETAESLFYEYLDTIDKLSDDNH